METKSDDNGPQQQREQGEEMRILVRAVNSEDIRCDSKGKPLYQRVDFHLVDLKRDKISNNFLPSMFTRFGRSKLMITGPFVCVFGGVHNDDDDEEDEHILTLDSHKYHYHKGASLLYLEKDFSNQCWERAALPFTKNEISYCASMLGKIYSFGYPMINPGVYDPRVGQWKGLGSYLPSHLVNSRVYHLVLPDPANHRILVYLSDRDEVYAFYPPKEDADEDESFDHSSDGKCERVDESSYDHSSGGKWKCIITNMFLREETAVVLDNIIFFHYRKCTNLVCAYDLTIGKWLRVVWSSVLVGNVDIRLWRCEFDAFFCCPGKERGMLCLAMWSPEYCTKPSSTWVNFFKFRVVERGTCDDSTVTLTPVSLQSYHIASSHRVYDFVPL